MGESVTDRSPLQAAETVPPFLIGGGRMGALIQKHDWTANSLGDLRLWPETLRAVVTLMLNSRFPMFLVWGSELNFLYNDAYIPILGAKHPNGLGRPFPEVWAEIWDELVPLVNQALAGEAIYHENLHLVMKRNGYPEDTWYSFSYSPLRDKSGAIAGMFCACTETTQQVLAVAALQDSQTRVRNVLENMGEAFALLDRDLRILDLNAEAMRLNDRPREFLIGKTHSEAHPDAAPELAQLYRKALSEQRAFSLEHNYIWPNGHDSWLDMRAYPVGENLAIFYRDITARKHADLRRLALAELGDKFRELTDPDEIAFAAAEMVGKTLGVDRAGYGTIDKAVETIRVVRDWTAPGVQSLTGILHFRDYGSHIEDLKQGVTVVIADVEDDPRTEAAADVLKSIGAQALINMPITEQGGTVALLYLNNKTVRNWSADELKFVQEVASRTRTAVERRRSEAALRESEARFEQIADSAPVPIWVSRLDRKRSFVNAAYLKFLGISYKEAVYFDWREILHPDDRDRIIAEMNVGEASLKPFSIEARYRRGDGEWRWGQSTSQPRFDADGTHSGFIGVAHDVTDARQAEAILRESEERFREQFENANDYIFTTDLEMRITSCNPAIAAALEHKPEELMGRSISDFTPPETWERNKVMLADKLAGKGDAAQYEVEVFDKDGHRMMWEVNSRLIRDSEGTPTGLHAISRDMSERIRNQLLLERARHSAEADAAEQAAILGQLAEGVIVTDASGRITFVNDAAMKLHGVAELDVEPSRYSKTYNLLREDGSSYPFEELPLSRAVLQGETVRNAHWRIRRPDESEVLVVGNAQPVIGPDGQAIGAVLTIRDDTSRNAAEMALRELNETLEERVILRTAELEQAQEALRQSQKLEAMGQLTGGVAHDFNNLLTPILGSLDLLQRKGVGDERQQRLIDGALQSAERAKLLVQRLLAFARRQPLKPIALDIGELIAGMAELVSSTCGPNIKVSVAIDKGLLPAIADSNQLEMAILNLSMNARDAMLDGGTLTLAATAEMIATGCEEQLTPGGYVRVSVADTGAGMDEETLQRAIEPFFSTKGVGRGTGLGLSMAHGLALQLGGKLNISSNPGIGTNVELWLPASTAPLIDKEPPESANAISANAGTVLLVDDESLVRATTADMLADLGYDVVEAVTAESALELFKSGRNFDLLVTDHLMPGMNGVDLSQAVREQQPDLPILIVSGYAETDGVPQWLPRLSKPFRQADLAAGIADIMNAQTPII